MFVRDIASGPEGGRLRSVDWSAVVIRGLAVPALARAAVRAA